MTVMLEGQDGSKCEVLAGIEFILFRALHHPLSIAQVSAVTRFMAMLRLGSTRTISEMKALAENEPPGFAGVQEAMGQGSGGIALLISDGVFDNLDQIRDQKSPPNTIACDAASDLSAMP